MKIIHTADWHLGKRLNGVSRLSEQRDVLNEIAAIAENERADVVIAAGDIYDSPVPPAEAEELFYEAAVRLTQNGRIFIALAGNHDDPSRLSAPANIARVLDIILVGGYDNSHYTRKNITGGNGFLRIEKGGEVLNLAVMPYPQHSRLSNPSNRDLSYGEIVKQRLDECCLCFRDGEFNVIASHLFLSQSGKAECLTDERELGTASLLNPQILPAADYTALGHIHKRMPVSKQGNIHYSGSILSYTFDESEDKSVTVVSLLSGGGQKRVEVKNVPLTSGRKLVKVQAQSFAAALEALKNNGCAYVQLEYNGSNPLMQSEVSELKRMPQLNKLVNCYSEAREDVRLKERSDEEIFTDFFKKEYGKEAQPSKELVEMFLSILNGEIETDGAETDGDGVEVQDDVNGGAD